MYETRECIPALKTVLEMRDSSKSVSVSLDACLRSNKAEWTWSADDRTLDREWEWLNYLKVSE